MFDLVYILYYLKIVEFLELYTIFESSYKKHMNLVLKYL